MGIAYTPAMFAPSTVSIAPLAATVSLSSLFRNSSNDGYEVGLEKTSFAFFALPEDGIG